jgi:hypothetical protein
MGLVDFIWFPLFLDTNRFTETAEIFRQVFVAERTDDIVRLDGWTILDQVHEVVFRGVNPL